MIEMRCLDCDETFILPHTPEEVGVIEHQEKADGTPCGSTRTEFAGEWVHSQWEEPHSSLIFVPSYWNITGHPPPPPRGGDAVAFVLLYVAAVATLVIVILAVVRS